jgi:iron complex outermembrane receptor protein
VFYYDYSDIQVELAILDPTSGIATNKLANASGADVYGFELESTWAATDRLTLLTNYSYLDSEYTDNFLVSDVKTNDIRNAKGNELNRTPNNKFTFAGYDYQPIGSGNLVFTANYSYVDDQYVTVFNDAIETIDSYEQVNARISWQPESGRYEVAAFGQNLTDEESFANDYAVSPLADGVRRSGRSIDPRVYGLEVAFFF